MSGERSGLVHWNGDTQGDGDIRRRDIVRIVSIRANSHQWRIDSLSSRVGMCGEVSAVFDREGVCCVLLDDGYWMDFFFDEVEKTGEVGSRFPEIYIVPVDIWSNP